VNCTYHKAFIIIRELYVLSTLPKKGWKQINVRKPAHEKAKEDAEKKGVTLYEYVETLIENAEVPA